MTYKPPVTQLMFRIGHPSHWERVPTRGAYSECNLSDISAAMTGYGQLCDERVASHGRDRTEPALTNAG